MPFFNMAKKKSAEEHKTDLVEEFWEAASFELPGTEFLQTFFNEFQRFIDPRQYDGKSMLRSLVSLVTELIE